MGPVGFQPLLPRFLRGSMRRGISDNHHDFCERGFLDIRDNLGDPTRSGQGIQQDSDSQLGGSNIVSLLHVGTSALSALIYSTEQYLLCWRSNLPCHCREQLLHPEALRHILTVGPRSIFRPVEVRREALMAQGILSLLLIGPSRVFRSKKSTISD
jgi:hypothetical protein